MVAFDVCHVSYSLNLGSYKNGHLCIDTAFALTSIGGWIGSREAKYLPWSLPIVHVNVSLYA